MAPLNCPFCCKETFSSHLSLKYHILGLLNSILCPSCNKRFGNLKDLAVHLGKECVNLPKSQVHYDLSNIKQEVDEASETNNAIELENGASIERHLRPKDIRDDPNMVYTCEMCDITFSSVQEHLAKYHEGEEVLLETEEEDETFEGPEEEDDAFAFSDHTDDDLFDEDGKTVEQDVNAASERRASTDNTKTTPKENEVDKDKEGLPYMRKEVKVETSLTQQTQNNPTEVSPITTKYIVEEGTVRKISEEEAVEISDKSRIIEIYSCPNCSLQFPNMTHFKKHNCKNATKLVNKTTQGGERKNQMQKIKEEFRYQCTFCLAIYSNLISLNDHMKSHLVQDDTGLVQKKTITMTLHICDICNTKFPTYKQLRLHSRMHDPVMAKQVDPPVSYNMMGQRNEEITETGNTEERETFECPICEKLYDKEYEGVHMKFHEEEEQHICLVCNRRFESKGNLDLHTKAHSNTKKFSCAYCKKLFNSYAALEDHVLKQCQKRDFECQYCGRRFGRPHEKVKHERIHTGEKPHICEICGKSFRVTYCLTLHMRTHTGNRPYACHQCGKRFKSHSVFNHHMKTHSDDRNYKCTYCPKAFKTAVQLAGHKNSHTKPFACPECNRPFSSLYAVRAHMDTHMRDNNLKYKCWICGASYARSFALRDHMKEAHGKDVASGDNQDERALMELEGVTDEAQSVDNSAIQSASEDPLGDGQEHHEMVAGEEEFEVTGAEGEICQVQILDEESEGDAYVHLQGVNANESIQENHMEVVEV